MISIGSILSDFVPQLAFLKSLRAFRALRPLRLLSRNAGMRLIIETLFEALPAVANVRTPRSEMPPSCRRGSSDVRSERDFGRSLVWCSCSSWSLPS